MKYIDFRDPLIVIPLIVTVVILIVSLMSLGYLLRWTGFAGYTDPTGEYHPYKTLWDWMELLIIPIVLASGALWLNSRERKADRENAEQRAKSEREIADDRNRENALQNYLDKMTELLLEHDLRTSESAQDIARARTVTTLRSLDGERKGILLQFLQESDLIKVEKPVVSLERADLSGAYLSLVRLNEAYLHWADLSGADLGWANLSGTNLRLADLRGTYLMGADLDGADLKWARYNDHTIWPDGFTPPPEANRD